MTKPPRKTPTVTVWVVQRLTTQKWWIDAGTFSIKRVAFLTAKEVKTISSYPTRILKRTERVVMGEK